MGGKKKGSKRGPDKSGTAAQQRKEPAQQQSSARDDPAALKAEGNEAFKAFKLDLAIELYSKAVAAAPHGAVYRSNRSAALFEAGRYAACLRDAEGAVALQPAPALEAKLALRAARCCLWLEDWDAADKWLAREVFKVEDCGATVRELQAQLAACRGTRGYERNAKLAAIAAGGDPDSMRLLRGKVQHERGVFFATGHDEARSMLEGACQRRTLAAHCSLRECCVERAAHLCATHSARTREAAAGQVRPQLHRSSSAWHCIRVTPNVASEPAALLAATIARSGVSCRAPRAADEGGSRQGRRRLRRGRRAAADAVGAAPAPVPLPRRCARRARRQGHAAAGRQRAAGGLR